MKRITTLITALMAIVSASAQTAAPEGSVQYYTRTGMYYSLDWDGLSTNDQSGCIGIVVDGNDVYFENLIQTINNDTWVKGSLGEDGKTVIIPQDNILFETSTWIEMPDGDWGEVKGYVRLSMLKYTVTDDGEVTFVRDTETPIALAIEDNTITLLNTAPEQEVLGAIYDGFDVESMNGKWNTGADYNTVMNLLDETPVTVPTDAVGEEYMLESVGGYSTDNSYEVVTLYTVGNDIYVKGFYSGEKNFAFKGTRDGDIVHFDGPQFVGVQSGYIMEVVGANYTKSEPDEWGWSDFSYEDIGAFDMKYDEETKTFAMEQGQVIRLTIRGMSYASSALLCDAVLYPYTDEVLTPAEPTIWSVTDYYDLEGDWDVYAELSLTSEEGQPLNEQHLSYRFYINDELHTFDAERYGLSEDLVEIPYTLSGNEYLNRLTFWGVHNYIQEPEIDKVGIQLVYRVGDEVRYSTINEYYVNYTAISDVEVYARQERGYNLQGQRVEADHHGLVIINGRKVMQ